MKTPVLLLLLALLFAANALAHSPANARYLGNEGILVQHGSTKVLFDAFYANDYGHYVLLDDDTTQALLEGAEPFDDITAVFVSHVHGDHFSPEPMAAYLRAQEQVVLYAPIQVSEALAELVGIDDPILERVRVIDTAPGEDPVHVDHEGLQIDVVAIPHAGGERMADIVNLAFRVTVDNDFTVLHLGDADAKVELFKPYTDHWNSIPVTAAFPPYWFFTSDEGWIVLDEYLQPRYRVGIHVPAEAAGQGDQWRAQAGADLFTDPGEAREFEHSEDQSAQSETDSEDG